MDVYILILFDQKYKTTLWIYLSTFLKLFFIMQPFSVSGTLLV